jgi:hypothetical protein
MVYRTVPNEPHVTLRFGASTFARRLRANFPAALRGTLIVAALGVVALGGGELLLSLAWDVRVSPGLRAFGIAVASSLVLAVVLGTLALVISSVNRSRSDRWIPRAMTFTEETIRVDEADGQQTDAGWSYLRSARRGPAEITLFFLAGEPRQFVVIRRAHLGDAQFELLSRWVGENIAAS